MSNLPATAQPWDQLPDETDTAYHRFSIYLKMGPERSLDSVRQKLSKTTSYKRQLATWSSKYNWVQRSGEYDKHIIKKSLENREEVMDMLHAKVISKAEDLVDELIDIAMHPGTEFGGEGTLNLYAQKLKALESLLDRIGFTKVKPGMDDEQPITITNYIQNVYKKLETIDE